jgi:chemotaxis family two-component system sensor kinase Cph1
VKGVCPADGDIRDLGAWLIANSAEPIFSTDHLSELYPSGARFQQTGSGVLAAILATDEPWVVLWFRVEQAQTVNWAGNPHADRKDDAKTLAPRASFDAWQEIVRGVARKWTLPETEAATRLRGALLDVQQTRHVHELNRRLTKTPHDRDLLFQQLQASEGR